MSATRSLLQASLKVAVDHVTHAGAWVVVVCPNTKLAQQAQDALSGMLPSRVESSGRTCLFPNRGRLSVTSADEPVFVPEDTPFVAMFLYWSAEKNYQGMAKWRERAELVIDAMHTPQDAVA